MVREGFNWGGQGGLRKGARFGDKGGWRGMVKARSGREE